eukprot:SAG31_NODE_314_length_17854_cov_3.932075_12_plen_215_part_00
MIADLLGIGPASDIPITINLPFPLIDPATATLQRRFIARACAVPRCFWFFRGFYHKRCRMRSQTSDMVLRGMCGQLPHTGLCLSTPFAKAMGYLFFFSAVCRAVVSAGAVPSSFSSPSAASCITGSGLPHHGGSPRTEGAWGCGRSTGRGMPSLARGCWEAESCHGAALPTSSTRVGTPIRTKFSRFKISTCNSCTYSCTSCQVPAWYLQVLTK